MLVWFAVPMTEPNSTTAAPPKPNSYLYDLVAIGLGSDPLAMIAELRSTEPPTTFVEISERLRAASGVRVTHETCRRWSSLLPTPENTSDPQ